MNEMIICLITTLKRDSASGLLDPLHYRVDKDIKRYPCKANNPDTTRCCCCLGCLPMVMPVTELDRSASKFGRPLGEGMLYLTDDLSLLFLKCYTTISYDMHIYNRGGGIRQGRDTAGS
jgi:hypothetical protein